MRVIASVLAVAAVCAAAIAAQDPSPHQSNIPSVEAATLLAAFEENEIDGDLTYTGNIWKITGRVGDIGKDLFGNPYVTLSTGWFSLRSVQCFLQVSKEQEKKLAALTPGDEIVLRGRVDRLALNVLVEDCSIYEEEAKEEESQ